MLLALLSSACAPLPHDTPTAETGEPPVTTELTWHADVAPIVTRSCVGCHTEAGIGGFSLSSYDQFVSWSSASRTAIASETMPPWGADGSCRTYKDDFSLSEDELDVVLSWIDGGLPEGDVSEAVAAVEPWTAPVLDRVDLRLSMPSEYTPTASPDDYRCFLLDWPLSESSWVTGFQFSPGNMDTVHHIIPFIIQPEDVADYEALESSDEGEGYGCYGGPGGDIETLIRTKWLGAWAPGAGASLLPEGTGISVQPGSKVVLQVHYYTGGGNMGPDQSAVELRVESEPQGWADLQPWTDVLWVAGLGMEIPAETSSVEHRFTYTVTEEDGEFAMYGAMLHMHQLGQRASLVVRRASGEEECVLDVPRYDFNWQRSYRLEEPVVLSEGDVVELSCEWDNLGNEDVAWGDGTGDEMCLGVTTLAGAP